MKTVLSYCAKDASVDRGYSVVAFAEEINDETDACHRRIKDRLSTDKNIRKNRKLFLIAFDEKEYGYVIAFAKWTPSGVAVVTNTGVYRNGKYARSSLDRTSGLGISGFAKESLRNYFCCRDAARMMTYSHVLGDKMPIAAMLVCQIVIRTARKYIADVPEAMHVCDVIEKLAANESDILEAFKSLHELGKNAHPDWPASKVLSLTALYRLDRIIFAVGCLHHDTMGQALIKLSYMSEAFAGIGRTINHRKKTKLVNKIMKSPMVRCDFITAKRLITLPNIMIRSIMLR